MTPHRCAGQGLPCVSPRTEIDICLHVASWDCKVLYYYTGSSKGSFWRCAEKRTRRVKRITVSAGCFDCRRACCLEATIS
jgi:hypothetical protein